MYDLIIRQAKSTDGSLMDIAIRDGKIAALGVPADASARHVLDLHGKVYASAGWIDSTFTVTPNHRFIAVNRSDRCRERRHYRGRCRKYRRE